MMRYWDVWLCGDLSVWEITPSDDAPESLNAFIRTIASSENRTGWRGWVQAVNASDAIAQAKACVQERTDRRRRIDLAGWAITP